MNRYLDRNMKAFRAYISLLNHILQALEIAALWPFVCKISQKDCAKTMIKRIPFFVGPSVSYIYTYIH